MVPPNNSTSLASPLFDLANGETAVRWQTWLVVFLLAFLLHLLFFIVRIEWSPSAYTPPPVEVNPVDPKKLDAIRKQWKQQKLLLGQNKTQEKVESAPDAKYMSDRNIRVEKEQRARDTAVIPKPSSRAKNRAAEPGAQTPSKSTPKRYPSLGNLGVRLDSKPLPPKAAQAAGERSMAQAGGSQYIDDNDAPTGSENLLNARESVFYSFYARLYEAIGPIWQSLLRETPPQTRLSAGDYTTSVDVVLDETGNLKEVRRLESSGIPEFDEAVDQAWKRVPRFPNPPQGLLDAERRVHTGWVFRVQVHAGSGVNFNLLPPERTY